ncbi:MAG: hypothetical protein WEA80_06045 [Gemmatimonadaceae bacterium]
MADAPMAIQGMRRSDQMPRAAQSICLVAIAILVVAGANGYEGVVLGGVLLSLCFLAGIGAFLAAFSELSAQQRDRSGGSPAHGGLVRLVDGSPGHTKFVVELPAARWQSEAGASARAPESRESAPRVPGKAPTSSS